MGEEIEGIITKLNSAQKKDPDNPVKNFFVKKFLFYFISILGGKNSSNIKCPHGRDAMD
jgi:hypothetical protein